MNVEGEDLRVWLGVGMAFCPECGTDRFYGFRTQWAATVKISSVRMGGAGAS